MLFCGPLTVFSSSPTSCSVTSSSFTPFGSPTERTCCGCTTWWPSCCGVRHIITFNWRCAAVFTARCFADIFLFDPLLELFRVGFRFLYQIAHTDLEAVLNPSNRQKASHTKLTDAIQTRIQLESAPSKLGRPRKVSPAPRYRRIPTSVSQPESPIAAAVPVVV